MEADKEVTKRLGDLPEPKYKYGRLCEEIEDKSFSEDDLSKSNRTAEVLADLIKVVD